VSVSKIVIIKKFVNISSFEKREDTGEQDAEDIGGRKLYNEELFNLHSSPDIIRVTKSSCM
jgi:hypothetical protein